jgi:DNA-binding GntR family transcriptional regulator
MMLTDADEAYHEIKRRIVTVEMPPGSVIQEAELMKTLSLGRTPIREALKRLQAENLVVVKPRRGMFVSSVVITDLTQIVEVRVELECLCAKLAARRVTPAQLDAMQPVLGEYETIDRRDLERLFELDHRFHSLLAEAASNDFLAQELELFYNLSLRIWYLALKHVRAEDVDVDSHCHIVAALQARDMAQAEKVMRAHIEHFQRAIKRYL